MIEGAHESDCNTVEASRKMNDLIPFLRQFRDSNAGPQHEPFVYRTEDTLSLHFDPMTIQSEMRRDAPEELILPYTRTMMGFLLYQPNPRPAAPLSLP